MWKLLRAAGFDKSQVEIYGEQTSGARWDLVDQCDIWLDSFPFNGGVSYAEALWSGIPAPCFPDSCARGRIAASHAYFSNLADDLLAPNQQAWEDLCVALAHDDDRRLRISGSQRAKMAASPFCDADRLALELEDGLRMIIEESFGRR
jgi:protein O-GlcNAc transferase